MGAWTTSSITSRFLVALLDQAGQAPDALLDAAGVSREALGEPDLAMPLSAFRQLWARAAALEPDIGLTMVERFPPGQMHMLAHLALRSATVEAALHDVCRHAGVTSSADALAYESDGSLARFSYASRAPGDDNPWMAEHYLAMAVHFIGQATGRPLPLRNVSFRAAPQAPMAAYRARFGLEPSFHASNNCIGFDATALAWPLRTHDAYLHDILERVAQARAGDTPDALLEQIRQHIATRLLHSEGATLEAIASTCQLSPRALRNRLAQRDSSFRQLLDEVRRDLAREHLARGLSVSETAYLLGFSEAAALQHACRRWFGRSAGELRQSLRPG